MNNSPKMGADQVEGEKDSETGGFVNMKRVEITSVIGLPSKATD